MQFLDFIKHQTLTFEKTKDIFWDAYRINQNFIEALNLPDDSLFKDFNKVYVMPYRVTEQDVAIIQGDPKTRIQAGPTFPEDRPSFDTNTGNIHLRIGPNSEQQLLFVRFVPGQHYGVKVDNLKAAQNPAISYNHFVKNQKEYFTPKACYYPPIDTTKFKTTEEQNLQNLLRTIYDSLIHPESF